MDQRQFSVLYVDDEVANLKAFQYAFGEQFRVVTAASGREALSVLERAPVAVLVADQRMPGMTGAELCGIVRDRFPDVIRIIVTAYSDITDAVAAIHSGQVSRYVLKPWREDAFVAALQAAMDAFLLGALTRQMQRRLLQAEQGAAVNYTVGRIMHEVCNPAAAVDANLVALRALVAQLAAKTSQWGAEEKEMFAELQATLAEAVDASQQLVARIDRFRQGGEVAGSRREGVRLAAAVEAAVGVVRPQLTGKATLQVELGEDCIAAVDDVELGQILVNLLINACESIESGAPLDNVIAVTAARRRGQAVVTVADSRPNVTAEATSRLFDASLGGTSDTGALALAIVRDVVRSAGGEIDAAPSPHGQGLVFTVSLPLAVETISR